MTSFQRLRKFGSETVRLAKRLVAQITDQFQAALRMSADGVRQVGVKTRRERFVALREFVYWLVPEFPIHSIAHLKPKHIAAYCRSMEAKQLKPATITTKLSHLAVLCRAIGKPELLDNAKQYFANPECLRRKVATTRDKSIEAAGLTFQDIYDKAAAISLVVAVQLALCWYFGLRAQESWLLRPHLAMRDGVFRIEHGTKGGRKRTLVGPFTKEQEYLIHFAQTFVMTDAESMIPRGHTLQEWRNYFYGVMRKIGFTRKQCGVTCHSLRHSFANREYERTSNRLSPVRGGVLGHSDPAAERAVRTVISDYLGHARGSITSAYVGSASPERPKK